MESPSGERTNEKRLVGSQSACQYMDEKYILHKT